MKIDTKILNTILENESINTLKGSYKSSGIYCRDEGFFDICKVINVIPHINKLKNGNHMIISTDAAKAFNKIKHSFMTTLQEVGTEGTYLNLIKVIFNT